MRNIFCDISKKIAERKQAANSKKISAIFNQFVGAEMLMKIMQWEVPGHFGMIDYVTQANVADKNDPRFAALAKTAKDNGLTLRLTSYCERGNRPYNNNHVRPHLEEVKDGSSKWESVDDETEVRYAKYRIKHIDVG